MPRRETRVVMAKEVLRISDKKVVVDYDFRNDSAEDVTTEVAFPIPPYKNEFPEEETQEQSFRSFRLWVNGKRVSYAAEAKATLKGKDVTAPLEADHIDIPTFGHFDDTGEDANRITQIEVPDFTRLPKAAQSRLIKEGFFEDLGGGTVVSLYTVHLQYHWTQTFPAHSTIHIRHEYAPAVGYQPIQLEAFKGVQSAGGTGQSRPKKVGREQDDKDLLLSFCPESSFLREAIRSIEQGDPASGSLEYPHWVDFILTSANTWQEPIEDFTLIVERPQPQLGGRVLVSFCSPGKVEKLDADHFQVHLTDFVPTSELHIGFFEVPGAKSTESTRKR